MSRCATSGPDFEDRKRAFNNCMTHNPLADVIGKGKNLEKHCCEMTGCDNPQVIDPVCKPVQAIRRPHFGDIRPEGVVHNGKYVHRGVGVL